jgi:hypothetical protein
VFTFIAHYFSHLFNVFDLSNSKFNFIIIDHNSTQVRNLQCRRVANFSSEPISSLFAKLIPSFVNLDYPNPKKFIWTIQHRHFRVSCFWTLNSWFDLKDKCRNGKKSKPLQPLINHGMTTLLRSVDSLHSQFELSRLLFYCFLFKSMFVYFSFVMFLFYLGLFGQTI